MAVAARFSAGGPFMAVLAAAIAICSVTAAEQAAVIPGTPHAEQAARNYSTLYYLQQRIAANPPRYAPPAARDEYPAWRDSAAARLREVFGVDESIPVALNPRVGPLLRRDGYALQHVVFSAEKNVDVPAWILIPDGVSAERPAPAVLCTHGTVIGGKDEVAGELANPAAAEGHAMYHDDYARQFARAGVVAFVIDLRNFGERRETFDPDPRGLNDGARHRQVLAINSALLGQSFFGLNLFDSIRALDYLETRPEVRRDAIGAVGFSLGGNLSAWLAAVDRRVKVVGIKGDCSSWRRSLLRPLDKPVPNRTDFHLMPGLTVQIVPAFLRDFDMNLSFALAAPTPMLIVNEYEMWPYANLREAEGDAQLILDVYSRFGAGEKIRIDHVAGPHVWEGDRVVPWVISRLRPPGETGGRERQ